MPSVFTLEGYEFGSDGILGSCCPPIADGLVSGLGAWYRERPYLGALVAIGGPILLGTLAVWLVSRRSRVPTRTPWTSR